MEGGGSVTLSGVAGVTPVTIFISEKNNCKQNVGPRNRKLAENYETFWPIVTEIGASSVAGVTVDEQVDNPPVLASFLNNIEHQRNTLENI